MMKKVEPSTTVSRTSQANELQIKRREEIVSGRGGAFDAVFPFFDFMYHYGDLPRGASFVAILYGMAQLLMPSYWFQTLLTPDLTRWYGKAMRVILEIILVTDIDSSNEESFSHSFIIGAGALTLAFVVAGVFLFFFFHAKRRFLGWAAILVRFYFEVFAMALLPPLSQFAGYQLVLCFGSATSTRVICFFAGVVLFAINAIIFCLNISLSSNSCIISKSISASICSSSYSYVVLVICCSLFIQQISALLMSWFQFGVAVVLCIVFGIGAFYSYKDIAFIHASMGAAVLSIYSANSIMSIYAFVHFLVPFSDFLTFVLPFVIALIFTIVFTQIFKFRMKNIGDQQSYGSVFKFFSKEDPSSPPSENDKSEYLESLGLANSNLLLLRHLRYGLFSASDLFKDWTLARFALSHSDSASMITNVLLFVSFFPSETRLLNSIFSQLTKRFDLSFKDRFLLYQVYRVIIIRQSSSSSEMTEILIEMRQISNDCFSMAKSFWCNPPSDIGFFWDYSRALSKTKSLWSEAIIEHPNSSAFYDEYTSFLIESATDFRSAVVQTHKRDLIEGGHSFAVDGSFRSLVWSFPHYLRKNILTTTGIFKQKGTEDGKQSGSSSSITGDTELDQELEDSISKAIIQQSRLRLAFQRSLDGRSSQNSEMLKIYSIIGLLISLAVVITIYCIYSSLFEGISGIMTQQLYHSRWLLYATLSRIAILNQWGTNAGEFHISSTITAQTSTDVNLSPEINVSGNLSQISLWESITSRNYLTSFYEIITQNAIDGVPIYTTASPYVHSIIPLTFCSGTTPLNSTINATLKSASSYILYLVTRISGMPASGYDSEPLFCNLIQNSIAISKYSMTYFDLLLSYESSWTDSEVQQIAIECGLIPIGLWILLTGPSLAFLELSLTELRDILQHLRGIDEKSRQSAAQPIQKKTMDDITASDTEVSHNYSFLLFVIIIFNAFVPIILIVFFAAAIVSTKDFKNISGWVTYGAPRNVFLVETIEHLYTALLLHSARNVNYTTRTLQGEYANESMTHLIDFQSKLILGTDEIEPCQGYDSTLDSLMNDKVCTSNASVTSAHERYRCASLKEVYEFANTYAKDVISRLNENITISDEVFYNFYHLVNSHALGRAVQMNSRLSSLSDVEISKFSGIIIAALIVGCACSVIAFIAQILVAIDIDSAYDASLTLMKRVPPNAIINSPSLEHFLLSIKGGSHTDEMSLSQKVIHSSVSAILCLNRNQIIDLMNPSVTQLVGYSPDQLLGQSFVSLLKGKDEISHQLSLMRIRQSSDVFKGKCEVISDDNREISCDITILAIGNGDEPNSYVVILIDESSLVQQQSIAEAAKKTNEDLLYQILPRDIVVKINGGEKDVSFSVQSSTIMFIDIVKFSEYAANLTPQQIMGNLSTIFCSFDSLLPKYPLITKIKLIGDIYMCAAGLFNPEIAPKDHAEQMIRFALDCLAELEEVNVKLDSNLSVRIGINTGGPILAGVLGTDKPVFDIIGDAINVAARLQSTCIPGKIQIPLSTFEFIRDLRYNIEPRGEVFLKGKGKTAAFIVSPCQFTISTHSSEAK